MENARAENLNCVFKRFEFQVFGGKRQNPKGSVNHLLNIENWICKDPILILLDPQYSNLLKGIEQEKLSCNIKISIEVTPGLPFGKESETNKKQNGEEDSGEAHNSNVTTAESSPIIKNFPGSEDDYLSEEGNRKSSTSEYINRVNYSRIHNSVKSSIKRQLTSNRYVDICRNPEWPFFKQSSKVISRNEQATAWSSRSAKGDLQNEENENSSSDTKKSSRGRARQWLESLPTLFDGVYTQRSTLGRTAGLGLFSDRHFEKNDIITEFVGWVIDRKEALRLRSEGKATHICDLVKPSLYLDGEKDPKPFIGGGSFANDGSTFLGGPGNNSRFWKWYDEREGRSRVFLKATQEINPGEEIFVGYCKDYWLDFAKKEINKTPSKNNSTDCSKGKRKDLNEKESIYNFKGKKRPKSELGSLCSKI
ncbi:SET domain containing lysine methyltransferase KMTox [Cryptosporidium felis]|nr:SET domain containing lysine methyltransferase KMTox [Cryptosporidium felis]